MQSSLAITALMMGVLGGPHCVAMCGAACAGLGQAAGERRALALLAFQLGRLAATRCWVPWPRPVCRAWAG
jgi:uncharacterized protein